MTVDEFLDWAAAQPSGRFELVDGRPVAMAPERARHNLVKAAVYKALDRALSQAGLDCVAYTDGMTVVIDEHRSREPDAAVQCGREVEPDSMILDAPTIVVEVTSPTSERDDTGAKLVEYFSLASVQHYLIVRTEQNVVVHHRRHGQAIQTSIAGDGTIRLDPPGVELEVAALLGRGADR
jgi:Uma2 family endonuclease